MYLAIWGRDTTCTWNLSLRLLEWAVAVDAWPVHSSVGVLACTFSKIYVDRVILVSRLASKGRIWVQLSRNRLNQIVTFRWGEIVGCLLVRISIVQNNNRWVGGVLILSSHNIATTWLNVSYVVKSLVEFLLAWEISPLGSHQLRLLLVNTTLLTVVWIQNGRVV
jgi:hypothetical protein